MSILDSGNFIALSILSLHDMKRFFNSRTKHTTTALVLTVWLLALGSGIANACLLEEARGIHSHAADIGQSPHAHAVTELHEHPTVMESDTEQLPAAKALCLDACDDRTNSLLKQDASIDPPHLAPLAVMAILWLAAQPTASATRRERANHANALAIPIRLRYSRLTL